ncbi:MAG TPA: tetratricopeptide repeat protein [Holophagaceae bacterium]|nr:tetratricopeptide repeat protein [Holophagaceae bacterium]
MPLPLPPPAIIAPSQAGLTAAAKKAFDQAYEDLQAGRVPEALEGYEKALAQAPDSWEVWLEYTSALRQAGFLQKAARAGWRTVELDAGRVDSWNNLANVLMDANAFAETLGVVEEMAKRFPGDPKAVKCFDNLGYAAWTMRDFVLAQKCLERTLQLAPGHLVAKVDLAGVLLSAGRPEGQARLEAALAEARKGKDDNAAKWAQMLLDDAKAGKGVLPAPFPRSWAAEVLPPVLRARPAAGKAAALPIQDPLPRAYMVGRVGSLRLAMPGGWWEGREGSDAEHGIVNLAFTPGHGEAFSVKVTAFLPPDPAKALTPDAAKGVLEKVIVKPGAQLHWLPEPRGAMAWARDPEWKPGKPDDFPHLLSALIQVGPTVVTVSCFWDESSPEPPKAFLDLIASLAWSKAS